MTLSKILAIMGFCIFLASIASKFLVFPKFLEWQFHKKINLKPGSDVRALWSSVPFGIDFRIYLFNVTNPDEIKNGAKPILREVGPYFFEEKHEKTDLIDQLDNDWVEYASKNSFTFKPEKSGGLTGEEELIVPHIFMLSMIMATAREKPSALPVVSKAINSIFKNPENIFVKVKAMDYMFRGLPIDCSVKDFAGAATCGLLRNKTDELIVDDPNHFRFSVFGAKNGTVSKNRLKLLRGFKSQADVGRVIEFNRKKNISTWNDKYCDTLNGTDGYIFRPLLKASENISTFSPDLCRSLSLYRIGKSEVGGLQTDRYTASLGDPNTDPAVKCYCPSTGCLKAGVMDLHKCVGIPIVASNAHFYDADETYLKMVEGLHPSKDKHKTFIDFDLFSGTIVQAQKRMQFSMMINKLDKFKIMANFPEALLPFFWIEEGLLIPDKFIKNVKGLHSFNAIVFWATWALTSVGLGLITIAAFLYYWTNKKAKTIKVINLPPIQNNVKRNCTRPQSLLFDVNPLRPAKLPTSVD